MKWFKLSSIGLVVVFLVASCSKYEEGPAISLRSKKERVVNTWTVDKAINEQGRDAAQFANLTWTFEENGDFTQAVGNRESNGEWEFRNDKEDLALIPENAQNDEEVLTIILLKEDEMKLEGSGQIEVELSEK